MLCLESSDCLDIAHTQNTCQRKDMTFSHSAPCFPGEGHLQHPKPLLRRNCLEAPGRCWPGMRVKTSMESLQQSYKVRNKMLVLDMLVFFDYDLLLVTCQLLMVVQEDGLFHEDTFVFATSLSDTICWMACWGHRGSWRKCSKLHVSWGTWHEAFKTIKKTSLSFESGLFLYIELLLNCRSCIPLIYLS